MGIAAVFVGCNNNADGVRAAFEDARAAFVAEDYRGVCRLLSPAARHQIGQIGHRTPTTCVRDLATRISAAYPSRRDRMEPIIQAVDVDGDAAVVTALLAGDTRTRIRLSKHDGSWKLDSIFGTSGPPLDLIPPPAEQSP